MTTKQDARPNLDTQLSPKIFADFYWLKEELMAFCKENNLPSTGGKQDIANRILEYLKSGEIIHPTKKISSTPRATINDQPLTLDTKIPAGYKNDERHRAFFKLEIGDHFKFNVAFMDWMKESAGKTYREAITEWKKSLKIRNKANGRLYLPNLNTINIHAISLIIILTQIEAMRLSVGIIRSHCPEVISMKSVTCRLS